MNDRELDALLGKYGKGYNSPPIDPPLAEIRERVHASRHRRARRQVFAMGFVAIAAGLLLVIGVLREDGGRIPQPQIIARNDAEVARVITDPRSEQANHAMLAALQSARSAVDSNPGDPFYIQHLEAMQSNTEYFRALEERQAGGSL